MGFSFIVYALIIYFSINSFLLGVAIDADNFKNQNLILRVICWYFLGIPTFLFVAVSTLVEKPLKKTRVYKLYFAMRDIVFVYVRFVILHKWNKLNERQMSFLDNLRNDKKTYANRIMLVVLNKVKKLNNL
jgi:hypothetical protein